MSSRYEVSSEDLAELDGLDYVDDYGAGLDDEDFRALGIDPARPTEGKPGSEEKVQMLAARYAAGLPLWHEEDCYDHGPGEPSDELDMEDDLDDD
jgi:hypothetical protein